VWCISDTFRLWRLTKYLCCKQLALYYSRPVSGTWFPVYPQRRLQSVQNAAARLIFRLRRSDHITITLATCAGAHNLQGCRPEVPCSNRRRTTVSAAIIRVADVSSRHRLQSSTSDDLIVPAVRLTSIGSRAFPLAGARIWNTLPLHVTSASSLTVFKQRLKLHLFCFSFPGLSPVWLLSGPCSVCCHLGHYIFFLIYWLIGFYPGPGFSLRIYDMLTTTAR